MSEAPRTWKHWLGWGLTGLVGLALAASGSMKIVHPASFLEGWTHNFGYPASRALPIGLVEICCAALLVLPRTAVLGAVLVAAYLGGATATHVRIGDPLFVAPVIFGVLAWGGIWLRDPRVRALLPLRS